MVKHSHKQQEALKDPRRMAIYDYLRGEEVAARRTCGSILEQGIDGAKDYAVAFYQIGVLEQAGLVVKEPGTNQYRAVEL